MLIIIFFIRPEIYNSLKTISLPTIAVKFMFEFRVLADVVGFLMFFYFLCNMRVSCLKFSSTILFTYFKTPICFFDNMKIKLFKPYAEKISWDYAKIEAVIKKCIDEVEQQSNISPKFWN